MRASTMLRSWARESFGETGFRLLRSDSTEPFFNLAFEEWYFAAHPSSARTLLLYQNQPCVIVGRFQNPHRECDLQRMQQDGIALVRRKTGGGAVYQDAGNSVFSFMSPEKPEEADAKRVTNSILLAALQSLHIPNAEATGRNDITVAGGLKVSGAAFQRDLKRQLLLHHGESASSCCTALSRAERESKLGQNPCPHMQ
jgi:lipoate-protein ligase A